MYLCALKKAQFVEVERESLVLVEVDSLVPVICLCFGLLLNAFE